MISGFSDFVRDWGYIAVFLGSIVEGESIVLTASIMAACGHLSIYKIFSIALITTIITDQVLFWLGYEMGTDWVIRKFPKIEKARDRVFSLLHKMDVLFIFSFRFIYGIRVASPIIIGAAKIEPRRFMIYNSLSGLCWAFVICFLGYILGDVIKDSRFDSMPAFIAIPILIVIVSGLMGLYFKVKERKLHNNMNDNNKKDDDDNINNRDD